LVVNIYGKLGL